MPDISTLVDDIKGLFSEAHVCDPAKVAALGQEIAGLVAMRMAERRNEPPHLRLSQIGKQDRQIWLDHNGIHVPEELPVDARIKFLYGDILEAMLWFLAEEAGHVVTDRQKEVEVDGVKGHLDGKIDGVIVDTKSASSYGYKKFAEGRLAREDDFGYMWQGASYAHAEGQNEMAFLVIDKTLGHICLDRHSEIFQYYNVPERIAHLRKIIASPEIPEQCYDLIPDGKSGNMKIDIGCSYCKHKGECFPALRTFLYSNGPRFLAVVKKEPQVPELGIDITPIEEEIISENG